jgi:hypothetical protein
MTRLFIVDRQTKEQSMLRNSWPSATGSGSSLLRRLDCILLVTSFGGMLLGLFPLQEAQATASITGSPFTTPGEQDFVVPPNITSLQVVLIGGAGGKGGKACQCQNGGPDGAPGAQGAMVTAEISVTPGQTIYVEVGGNGGKGADGPSTFADCHYPGHEPGGAGGTNGGGTGGTGINCLGGGGGGGGFSALRVCPISGSGCPANPWLVIAGGGGGGSAAGAGAGGAGGTPNGSDGQTSGYGGGRGGTQTAAGAGGEEAGGYTAGSAGSGTHGGTGGNFAGGGGGGGYFGGGGGGWGGGGGGGSSYGSAGATYTTSSNPPSVTVTYNDDTTAPTSTALTIPASPDGNNGWFKNNVTVNLSASDNTGGTGVASITYSLNNGTPITVNAASTSLTVSTEGTNTISYYATDNASNAETSKTMTIKLDKTGPSGVSGSAERAPDGGGYYNHSVQVSFSGTDATSGIASCTTATYSGPDSSSTRVSGSCTDNAGNTTSASFNLKYDATKPTINTSASNGTGSNYTAGSWTNQSVTVSFSCSDTTSGIASGACPVPTTVSAEGITNAVNGTVSDQAGNSASTSFGPIMIDKTAPGVTATPDRAPNTNGWYNKSVTFSFSGVDNTGGSGIARCDLAQSYSGPDSDTAAVAGSCRDVAGNVGSVTANLKYDATPPTVTYTGNAGSYTIDQAINITCQATDNLSGVASDTCANITGPAYNFALGSTTRSASATDNAGNMDSNSTSFTVNATADSLSSLTARFSTDPAVTKGLTDKLAAAKAAAGDTKTKNNILNAYRQQVSAQSGKAFTSQQATILINLSKAL